MKLLPFYYRAWFTRPEQEAFSNVGSACPYISPGYTAWDIHGSISPVNVQVSRSLWQNES